MSDDWKGKYESLVIEYQDLKNTSAEYEAELEKELQEASFNVTKAEQKRVESDKAFTNATQQLNETNVEIVKLQVSLNEVCPCFVYTTCERTLVSVIIHPSLPTLCSFLTVNFLLILVGGGCTFGLDEINKSSRTNNR